MVDSFVLQVKAIKTVVNNLGPDVPDAQLIGPHSAGFMLQYTIVLDFVAKNTPVFAKQHCSGDLPPQTQRSCCDEGLCHW